MIRFDLLLHWICTDCVASVLITFLSGYLIHKLFINWFGRKFTVIVAVIWFDDVFNQVISLLVWCEYDHHLCKYDLYTCGPQAQYPGLLSRARGQGTFCAIDICDDATRNSILLKARDKGTSLFFFFSFLELYDYMQCYENKIGI